MTDSHNMEKKMDSIAVFCASSLGNSGVYAASARQVGTLLAENNITLVYGGGRAGLMGVVADAVMQQGGKAIGVIPRFLATAEIAHHGLTELILVDSMHERKLRMSELCEGVMALPGGFGTLEELTEMLTWSQLQLHYKPIGILNVNGYYDFLQQMFDHMVQEGLLKQENRALAVFSEDPRMLLEQMRLHGEASRKLDKEKT